MNESVIQQTTYIDNGNAIDITCGRTTYWCGNCRSIIKRNNKFCRSCGKDLDFKNIKILKDKHIRG